MKILFWSGVVILAAALFAFLYFILWIHTYSDRDDDEPLWKWLIRKATRSEQ